MNGNGIHPPPPVQMSGGNDLDLVQQQGMQNTLLRRINLSLLKLNPDVLANLVVQGVNPIASGDTKAHRVTFSIGNRRVEVYKIIAFSSFSGDVAISPVMMNSVLGGMQLSVNPIELHIPLNELYITTDGSAACGINENADPTNGGVYIYPFTIPAYEMFGVENG